MRICQRGIVRSLEMSTCRDGMSVKDDEFRYSV